MIDRRNRARLKWHFIASFVINRRVDRRRQNLRDGNGNFLVRELDAQDLQETSNAVFRRAVCRLIRRGTPRFRRREMNQRAAILLQMRQSGFGTVNLTEQIDLDQTLVFFGRSFFDGRENKRRRRMNPGVEPSESLDGFIGNGFDLFEIRRVGNEIKRFAAVCLNFFNQGSQTFFAARRDANLRAAPREFQSRQPPDAA